MVAKQRELSLKLPQIEFGIIGGSTITPKLIQDATKVLNIKKFRSIYGLTEGTSSVFLSQPNEDPKLVEEFVGQVCDDLEVKLIDKNGETVPFGQPGELNIRGYNTMLGYWDDEEKTREVMSNDKWLKTGDKFVLNKDGYGKFVGRLKEMIVRGGENLFPKEIEDFLNSHPNILEAHVVGIPDERLGEEVGAFIRLKDSKKPLTRDDVKEFCEGSLSHFKIPRYVIIVCEFPRTASGKVQKFSFAECFADKIKCA